MQILRQLRQPTNLILIYAVGALTLFAVVLTCTRSLTERGVVFEVTGKEILKSHPHQHLLVHAKGETFEVRDSIIHGQFQSSAMFEEIVPGTQYVATVYGTRQGLFGGYRNLVKVRKSE